MSTGARGRLRPTLGAVAAITTIVVLHHLGRGPLAVPSVGAGSDLAAWMSARDPVTVGFALFRLGALVLAYHLAITTTIAAIGQVLQRPDLVRRATAWTLPPFRAGVARAVGLGLSAATVLTTPAPSPVAAAPPAITATVDAAIPDAAIPGATADMATHARLGDDVGAVDDPTDTALDEEAEVAEVAVLQPTSEDTGSATLRLAPVPAPPGTATLSESEPRRSTDTESPGGNQSITASTRDATADDTTSATTRSTTATDDPGTAPDTSVVDEREPGPPRDAGQPAGTAVDAPPHGPAPAVEAAPGSGCHVVVPGDHLWSIAADTLAAVLGRPPSDEEVAPYWRRVVDANPQLVDADLLFAGDEIIVPAP